MDSLWCESLWREAAAHFIEGEVTFVPTEGGVNNVNVFMYGSDGTGYVLRIYNNANNGPQIAFEHEILKQLREQDLSFQVPHAIPSRTGPLCVPLSSGTQACLFHIIAGTLAKMTSPGEVGRATGELSAALAKVKVDIQPTAPAYYNIWNVHHAIQGDREIFYCEVATNPVYDSCRLAVDYLVGHVRQIETKLAAFAVLSLPVQLIHGDLHYDNVLVLDDKVSGILDFEFCTYDWRAMELAIALSKYISAPDPFGLCCLFISGYAKHADLTVAEIEALPDLILLRILSNTVFFVSRIMVGEEAAETLTGRADAYMQRMEWIFANKERLIEVMKSKFLTKS